MIAGRATPVKMAPGHEICSQGDPADCIWLLHEGTPRSLPPGFGCLHAQFPSKAQQLAYINVHGQALGNQQKLY